MPGLLFQEAILDGRLNRIFQPAILLVRAASSQLRPLELF